MPLPLLLACLVACICASVDYSHTTFRSGHHEGWTILEHKGQIAHDNHGVTMMSRPHIISDAEFDTNFLRVRGSWKALTEENYPLANYNNFGVVVATDGAFKCVRPFHLRFKANFCVVLKPLNLPMGSFLVILGTQ